MTPSARPGYDRIIDLQIWPNRMAEWKASPLDWMDFVYGLLPEGGEINRQIVLSPPRDLAPSWLKESVACFPTGYSQEWPVHPAEALAVAHKVAAGAPVLAIGKRDHGMAELPAIEHLCAYIQQAKQVVTINTSASILASALRPNWVHIADHPKHDWKHANQIRIERADTAPTA